MRPEAASLYAGLRAARSRHYRNTLIERAMRMRQNALVAAGVLGMVLLPVMMIVFVPANRLLRSNQALSVLYAALFLQALSWTLLLIQHGALSHRPSERFLGSWPIERALRHKLNLRMLVVANHLLWLVTLPSLIWFLYTADDRAVALLHSLKLIVLLYLAIGLQLRQMTTGLVPWLHFFIVHLVFFGGLVVAERSAAPLSYLLLLLAPAALHIVPTPARRVALGHRRPMLPAVRARLMRRLPWAGLHALMLGAPNAQPQYWRVLAAVGAVAASPYVFEYLPKPYAFLALMALLFGVIYIINGLYYFFAECHRKAQPLLDSWGISRSTLLRQNLLVFTTADSLLVLFMLTNALAAGHIDAVQGVFAIACAVIYVPLLFLISIKSPDNVLSYSLLAYFPACIAALMLTF